MSKSSYLTANVDVTSDSFGGWIGKTNLVISDMATVVVTVNDVAQPNTTNGAMTTGNAHVEGIFSATSLSAVSGLRGGTVSTPALLHITSNADFTSTNGTVDITSSINLFTVDANNVVISSNVVFDGGSTKIFKIDAANTVINTGSLYAKSNTYISGTNTYITSTELKSTSNTIITGSRVDIDGTTFDVTSNTIFTAASLNANVDIMTIGFSGADALNVNALSDFNANVNIDGVLTQTANATFSGALVNITSANTTVGDAGSDVLNVNAISSLKANVAITSTATSFTVAANTTLSGANVYITSTNTTIGDAATDRLNVNATSDFNANVNIDGILTQTANAIFSGALVNITSANTTVGDAGADKLNVNATSDFNANVNIDGLFTVTANATFTGAETYFDNNVTLGATTADTVSILGYVDANVLPSATTVDLGSDAKPWGNVHTTYVWSDSDVETQGEFVVRGSTARVLKSLSTNTSYQNLNVVLRTSTGNEKFPLVANSSGIHAGANTTYDLGSIAVNWANLYVKDAAVANSAVVSNVLTVNTQANTASLMVRDLTATRIPFVSTAGEIVDSANLTYASANSTLVVTGNTSVSADLSVGGNAVVTGTATINTQANTASLMVRDLTATRLVYVGTGGEIVDSANLVFSGTSLSVTGNTSISANLAVTNVVSAANLAVTHVGTSTLGTSGLATLNSMTVTNIATFNANVDLQDSDYLLIGTGDDLQIYHDGLNSYIKDTGTGDLIVDASTFRVMNAANTESMIVAIQNSGVTLYTNNVARVETTLVGANVTGTFGTSGLATLNSANVATTFQVNGLSTLAGNTAFSNNVVISGDLTVSGTTNIATNTNFVVNNAISTTSTVNDLLTVNGNTSIGDTSTDILTLNAKVVNSIIPNANNTYDIGSATNIYKTITANNFVGSTEWASVQNKPDPVVTVTLSGDVAGTGNATLTDLGNGTVSITTTVQPNSVALGADTTGNYMSGVTAGSGITISHTPGEGSSATISHTDTSSVANVAIDNSNGTVLQDLALSFDTFGHVTAISSASTNLDNRYPQVTFKTFTVTDTDTGFAWANTGSVDADGLTDTMTIVSGTDIDIDADTTNDAIRVTNTSTLSSVTGRGATTDSAISITNTTDATSINTGALKVSGGLGLAKNIWIGGTANVASTMAVVGAASFGNNVTIAGNLTVNGTTTTINSTTVSYDDKNIELGSVVTPSDAGADGGGITLKGTTDKTFNWVSASNAWTSSEHMNLLTGKAYYINGTSVLNSTTLGSGVTGSSLTSVGTISSGTWSASTIAVNKGGTGQTSYTNGQLLIGNSTGNTLTKATLTAGNNITITNAAGAITITAADSVTDLGYTANTTFGTVTSSSGNNAVIPAANSTVAGLVTTGAQTIAGAKTFSSTIVGSISGNANTVTNGVYTSGDQTIAGIKTFSGSIVVPSIVVPLITSSADITLRPTGDTVYMQGTTSGEQLTFQLDTTTQTISSSDYLIVTGNTGTSLSTTAGDVTLDSAGDIILDAAGGQIYLYANEASRGYIDVATANTLKIYAGTTLNTTLSSNNMLVGGVITATGGFSGNVTGNVTGSSGSTTGNANTVTNGVYTTGDQTIAGIKTFSNTISGSIDGNSATVTNGVYTVGNQTIAGIKTFSSTIVGSISGNANTSTTATKWATERTISLGGDLTGSATIDGSANVTITATVTNDSHTHAFNSLTGKTSGTGDYTTTGTFTAATFNATSTTNGGFQGIDADTIAAPSFTWTSDLNTGMWHAAADQIGFTTGGTNRMTVSSTGIAVVGAVSATGDISSTSDARLKENVITIDSALNKVEQMRGVYFNKIGVDARSVGVIAQEMEEVLPEVVATDDEGMKSVAYANIVGVLIEAIKELKAEIDILKNAK